MHGVADNRISGPEVSPPRHHSIRYNNMTYWGRDGGTEASRLNERFHNTSCTVEITTATGLEDAMLRLF